MRFRNDLCCKRKVKFDFESAAVAFGTHPAKHLYICSECGFLHFAADEDSRIDRMHLKALRIERHLSMPRQQVRPLRIDRKVKEASGRNPWDSAKGGKGLAKSLYGRLQQLPSVSSCSGKNI